MDATEAGGIAVAALVPVLGVIYAINPWGIVHGKGPAGPPQTEGPTDPATVVGDDPQNGNES